jgi:hypothetical protein
MQSHGVSVLGGHPEIALDFLGDTGREIVVEKWSVSPQVGEQIIGKTVAPQGGIRKVQCGGRHLQPRFTGGDAGTLAEPPYRRALTFNA